MNEFAKPMHLEMLTTATSLEFLCDAFPVYELWFNIDNEPYWILFATFKKLFTKPEFTETCSAFVCNLANPSKFMNSKVVRKHEVPFPLELKLKAKMDGLSEI